MPKPVVALVPEDITNTSTGVKPSSDDTLFQGGRELWLAKRLTDPEIYLPLQASKEIPAPPGVQYRTKTAVHRQLASEFNQQKEHAGFIVDGGKIKNKISKMSQHFKLAHRFRHSSDFGTVDDMTRRDAVKEKYSLYFILEPVWASVWNDSTAPRTHSISAVDDNVITHCPHLTDNAQVHSDESSKDGRDDVDTGPKHDQESMEVATTARNIEDGADEEEPQDGNRRQWPETSATPANGSRLTIISLADKDGRSITNGKSKESQRKPISDVLKVLSELGRYEIDARKETEMRQMDLIQKTELAEIELRKTIRLAEINTTVVQERPVLDLERQHLLELERRISSKEKELDKLLEITKKQLGLPHPVDGT